MRVIVTNPPWWGTRAGSRWPSKSEWGSYFPYPIHLAGAVSTLRKNHAFVTFFDAVAKRMRMEQLDAYIEQVRQIRPQLIIQAISTPSIVEDEVIAKRLSEIAPVAVTGPHATSFGERMLKDWPFLFAVLQGEIELNSVDLMNRMEPGVYGFKSAKNLDEYPFPAQENLYLYRDVPGPHGGVTYQTWASRGCFARCKFCIEPWADTGKASWRKKSPKYVVDECIEAKRKFPLLDGVYLDGPTENVGDDRCKEIADRFSMADIPFSMMTRLDTLELETWDYMLDRGFFYVKAGMESGVQELVDHTGKNLDLDKCTETVRHLKKRMHPRSIHLTCMYGIPGETKDTVYRTLKYLKSLGVYFQESYMAPVPGTPYWDNAKELYPVEELAMGGKAAPGNPDVAQWVRECKVELGMA